MFINMVKVDIIENQSLRELYEKDYLEWIEKNIRLIREGQIDNLDFENLI